MDVGCYELFAVAMGRGPARSSLLRGAALRRACWGPACGAWGRWGVREGGGLEVGGGGGVWRWSLEVEGLEVESGGGVWGEESVGGGRSLGGNSL